MSNHQKRRPRRRRQVHGPSGTPTRHRDTKPGFMSRLTDNVSHLVYRDIRGFSYDVIAAFTRGFNR